MRLLRLNFLMQTSVDEQLAALERGFGAMDIKMDDTRAAVYQSVNQLLAQDVVLNVTAMESLVAGGGQNEGSSGTQ